MNTEERIKKQKELVERIGRHYDKEGFQPIAGRILGLLMVMDKELYTFDEIVEELQISKSSASNTLRNLEIRGVIEYITQPGDRRRYFRIKRMEKLRLIDDFKTKMEGMHDLFINILSLKADKNSANAQFFNEVVSMLDFFLAKFDTLMKEYIESK